MFAFFLIGQGVIFFVLTIALPSKYRQRWSRFKHFSLYIKIYARLRRENCAYTQVFLVVLDLFIKYHKAIELAYSFWFSNMEFILITVKKYTQEKVVFTNKP